MIDTFPELVLNHALFRPKRDKFHHLEILDYRRFRSAKSSIFQDFKIIEIRLLGRKSA